MVTRCSIGYHGINRILEDALLESELVAKVARLLVEEDIPTASAMFDELADEHGLLRWQRMLLAAKARSLRMRLLHRSDEDAPGVGP